MRSFIVVTAAIILVAASAATAMASPPPKGTDYATILDQLERMAGAGAHYVVDSINEVLPCLEDINRRLASGERP